MRKFFDISPPIAFRGPRRLEQVSVQVIAIKVICWSNVIFLRLAKGEKQVLWDWIPEKNITPGLERKEPDWKDSRRTQRKMYNRSKSC